MDDWWGYSKRHGWIYIDREIECNHKSGSNMIIIRCSDNAAYVERYSAWNSTKYSYEDPDKIQILKGYLEKRDTFYKTSKTFYEQDYDPRGKPTEFPELERKEAAEQKKEIIEKHKKYLLDRKLAYKGVVGLSNIRKHRTPHCWSCGNDLDNNIHMECGACGWIICVCGACGCDYNQSTNLVDLSDDIPF